MVCNHLEDGTPTPIHEAETVPGEPHLLPPVVMKPLKRPAAQQPKTKAAAIIKPLATKQYLHFCCHCMKNDTTVTSSDKIRALLIFTICKYVVLTIVLWAQKDPGQLVAYVMQ